MHHAEAQVVAPSPLVVPPPADAVLKKECPGVRIPRDRGEGIEGNDGVELTADPPSGGGEAQAAVELEMLSEQRLPVLADEIEGGVEQPGQRLVRNAVGRGGDRLVRALQHRGARFHPECLHARVEFPQWGGQPEPTRTRTRAMARWPVCRPWMAGRWRAESADGGEQRKESGWNLPGAAYSNARGRSR